MPKIIFENNIIVYDNFTNITVLISVYNNYFFYKKITETPLIF